MTDTPSTGANRANTTDANTTEASSDLPTDVLIVGAGPAGLLLAGDLAAQRLSVTVVERRPPGTSSLTRAFAVHARTLELLDARGLADDLIRTGTCLDQLEIFGRVSLDLTRLRSRFPFVLITPQYEVERLLKDRALKAGVRFRHGTELVGLSQSAAGTVTADLRGTDGAGSTVGARYLVGTDGVRSSVRRALGLPFPGESVIRSIILADVRLTGTPPEVLTVNGVGDSFAFIAPFGDGWYRVMGWDRTRQTDDSDPVELDELRGIARTALGTDYGMHGARWLSRFHSDERQVPAYRTGRVFLAGDAAHVHSPAGGQGMNTGLQDAANLSWKLAAVLRGHSAEPEALLDSYHTERHPVGSQVLRTSGAIIRLAMASTPGQRATRTALTRLLSAVRPASDKAIARISGIGISYPAPRGSHRLTGTRAPALRLAEGRLPELLREGAFVLVTPPGAPGPTGPVPLVHAHWTSDRTLTLLVRPDGHIAWAGTHPGPGTLAKALG
ncbi:FAD-dependent monooxygenase [Streptomyces sp. NPDC059398]|uniref:FAD-dependent monooxygenase n=1 Tax=Streptomyces sp. NPDC059398 TaxID=3346820 RepID=UPI00369BBE7B